MSVPLPQPVALAAHVYQWAFPAATTAIALTTNTYAIVDQGEALLVDAGSDETEAVQFTLQQLSAWGVQRVIALVATHYHRDHTLGLAPLQAALQVPLWLHTLDLPPAVRTLGPGVQLQPAPDKVQVGSLTVLVRHAPGHTHGHLHLEIPAEQVVLVGDHLAGHGSVWIGPPDGHLDAYYQALDQIVRCGCTLAGPGHGPALTDAAAAARSLRARREHRELQIWQTLHQRPTTLDHLVQHLYGQLQPPFLHTMARRTVQAHLQRLLDHGHVQRRFHSGQGFVFMAKEAPP
ncbi:MAG: MBL fold metallo-hydrolase [Alicyclobacillus sp.]|nr:MBL fold metallo-hydrolase [Alicyclobacillus sp.]